MSVHPAIMQTDPSRPDLLSDAERALLTDEVTAYAQTHGLLMGTAEGTLDTCPITVLPVQFPRHVYTQCETLGADFNALFDAVSGDSAYLLKTLQTSAAEDPFMAKQVELLAKIVAEQAQNPSFKPIATFSIARSDYMVDDPGDGKQAPYQIEYNTIAASFSSLSSKVGETHQYVLNRFFGGNRLQDSPSNKAVQGIAAGMAQAFKLHSQNASTTLHQVETKTTTPYTYVVVMVVQPGEKNSFDQRLLEFELTEQHKVPLIRRSMAQIHATGSLEHVTGVGGTKDLVLEGRYLARVIYSRAGYTPNDYKSDVEWEAKTTMEFSSAIKCPNIGYWLAGSKKVQQALAEKGALEQFLPQQPDRVARIRNSFVGLWSLDPSEYSDDAERAAAVAAVEDAKINYDNYVLKPQREGGGNNSWGEEIKTALESKTTQELRAYILMQKIVPQTVKALILRGGKTSLVDAVNELGVFSVFLKDHTGDVDQVVLDTVVGPLLRTKKVGVYEGGVATGYAVLSSPLLTDINTTTTTTTTTTTNVTV